MVDELLRLEGVTIDLQPRGRMSSEPAVLLRGVNLGLREKQVLGILGEGGSGKTTLARAMVGWIQPPLRLREGVISYKGKNLLETEGQRLGRAAIGFIGSDPGNAFDQTTSVGSQIAEKLRTVRPAVGVREARDKVIELFDLVRIPSAKGRFDEYPNQYSGGMLQRAVIVDALITDPEILICDNMLQSLDVTIAMQVIRLVKRLRDRLAAGIVFMTTSIPSLMQIADEVAVLVDGSIVESGKAQEVLERPQHLATKELWSRTPRIWAAAPFATKVDVAKSEGPALLVVDNVGKTYRKKDRSRFFGYEEIKAVRGVSLDVRQGENLGLVGESGCGKSTLSRVLSWVEAPDYGSISYQGTNIADMNGSERKQMRRGFQLLLQDPYNCLPPNLSVGDSISYGLRVHHIEKPKIVKIVRAAMAEVGLKQDDFDRLPVGLSAGQRQRVNIARALVLQPNLLILDETLSSLDPVEQSDLLGLFGELQSRHGFTYMFISHDLAMVRKVCTRTAVMYLGKIVEIGDTRDIFQRPSHPYTRALLSAVPSLDKGPFDPNKYLLEGEPPDPINLPAGCTFASRCPVATEICLRVEPHLVENVPGHRAACHHPYIELKE